MIQYKLKGSFESFALDDKFISGFTETTGLGSAPEQAIQQKVQQQMASHNPNQGTPQSQSSNGTPQNGASQSQSNNGQPQNDNQNSQNSNPNSQSGTGQSQQGNQNSQQGTPQSQSGLAGPLAGLSPWEGSGAELGDENGAGGNGKGTTAEANKDPNNKSQANSGWCLRAPFDEKAAKLGAEAIYNGKKYQLDIDETASKDPKRAVKDYRDTLEGIKSVLTRTNQNAQKAMLDMGASEHIKRELAPVVNWRALLERYVSRGCEAIYTYSKPDRRFLGSNQIYPGPKFTDDMIKDMVIGIDSSGSISDAELAVAVGHIWHIYKKYQVNAKLFYWADACTYAGDLKSKGDLSRMPGSKITGGTNVDCLFTEINNRMKGPAQRRIDPSVIVIFTDGWFSPPSVVPKCGTDKVIWVITTENDFHKFTPAFGTKAMLNFDKLN